MLLSHTFMLVIEHLKGFVSLSIYSEAVDHYIDSTTCCYSVLPVRNTNSNFLALFSKTPVFTAEEKVSQPYLTLVAILISLTFEMSKV